MQVNKQISYIHRRLLYQQKISPLNIYYTKSNTEYDNMFSEIQNPLWNFMSYESGLESNLYPHLYFINNPLEYSQNYNQFIDYIPKVLFFHNESVVSMKKEDAYLLNKRLKQYQKYSFMPVLRNIITDMNVINYGFKEVDPIEIMSNKNKSILFIAEESNLDTMIFSQIKQKYQDADIYISNNSSINLSSILSNYKICINFHNQYNTLLAASKGCITLSDRIQEDIPHNYVAKGSLEVLELLSYLESAAQDDYYINNYNHIIKKYPYKEFISSIENIIDQTCI
jgi:hypothetical protein